MRRRFLVSDPVLLLEPIESIITQHLSLSKLAGTRYEIYGFKILRSFALRSGDKPRKSVTSFCACCAETGAISSFPFPHRPRIPCRRRFLLERSQGQHSDPAARPAEGHKLFRTG